MDKKGQGTVSTSDSYYFQLIPSYFKVEHGFAKTIKPNTTYRLSIFKGILTSIQEFRRLTKWLKV